MAGLGTQSRRAPVPKTTVVTHDLAASFQGEGSLTANLSRRASFSTSFQAEGILAADLTHIATLATSFQAEGILAANLKKIYQFSSSFQAEGILTANLKKLYQFSTTLQAEGILTAALTRRATFASSLQAEGILTAALIRRQALAASLQAEGILTAALIRRQALAASLQGEGLLTANLEVIGAIVELSASFQAEGILSANLKKIYQFSTSLQGEGTLTANLKKLYQLSTNLQAEGTLTANLTRRKNLAASLQAEGILAASLIRRQALAASLQAEGLLVPTLKQIHKLSSLLQAEGLLTANLDIVRLITTVTGKLAYPNGTGIPGIPILFKLLPGMFFTSVVSSSSHNHTYNDSVTSTLAITLNNVGVGDLIALFIAGSNNAGVGSAPASFSTPSDDDGNSYTQRKNLSFYSSSPPGVGMRCELWTATATANGTVIISVSHPGMIHYLSGIAYLYKNHGGLDQTFGAIDEYNFFPHPYAWNHDYTGAPAPPNILTQVYFVASAEATAGMDLTTGTGWEQEIEDTVSAGVGHLSLWSGSKNNISSDDLSITFDGGDGYVAAVLALEIIAQEGGTIAEIASNLSTITDDSGAFSIDLVPNEVITPVNSLYQVTEKLPWALGGTRVFAINVPAAGGSILDLLV